MNEINLAECKISNSKYVFCVYSLTSHHPLFIGMSDVKVQEHEQ